MTAALPEHEMQRLDALRRLELLDTEPEPEFDELVTLAAAICGVPISLVTLLDERRQWFKASFGLGLDTRETPREFAFCAHTILQPELFVVEDATTDVRFSENPYVTADPNIRFYAGFPISSPEGHAVGSLCVIDRQPRKLSKLQMDMLVMLGRQVNARMELRLQRRQLQAALGETDRSRNELRMSEERFRTFMDNSPFLSYMKDMDGRLVFYNQRFADRFRISLSQWLGKSDEDLWPSERAQSVRQNDISVLMAGTLQVVEEEVRDTGGIVSHWRSYKFPCVSSRGETLLAGVAVDVTDTREKELMLERTRAELQAANERLKELVVTDALTGLGNRRVFEERLAAEMTAIRRGRRIAMLMLDIDHFKDRNDSYGHQDGDEVLRQIGALMKRIVRGNELAARYGGEELVVLMPGASEDEAAGLARRLLRAMRSEQWKHRPITVSIGVAESTAHMTGDELVSNADAALYAAKAAGRDRYVRHSEAT